MPGLRAIFRATRPGWLLIALILIGGVIGIIGDFYIACPPSPSPCAPVTFLLAQNNGDVIYSHAYFQLYTSNFVTDSLLDIAFNAIAVLVIDRFVDSAFNKTRYIATFYLTALSGNILTLLAGPGYVSAGASGGIFGLLAATFSFSWAEERRIDRGTLILFLVVFGLSSFLMSDVNWLAHLGGAIGGFVIGPGLYLSLKRKMKKYEPTSESSKFVIWATAILLLLATVGSVVQFILFIS